MQNCLCIETKRYSAPARFTSVEAQPPRPPQQFSSRKLVSRFTFSKFAEYEMERPFLCGRTSSVAAKTFRWKESVGPGNLRRRAIVPAGRPLGACRTSKRKMFSRVSCASAASESTAYDVFIFPKQWKYKAISPFSQMSERCGNRTRGIPAKTTSPTM